MDDQTAPTSSTTRGPSRRAVIGTTAWSIPAVAVVGAAPAYAAFSPATTLGAGTVDLTPRSFMSGTVYYSWNGNAYSGPSDQVQTTSTDTILFIRVRGVTSTGGAGSDTVTLQVSIPDQGPVERAKPVNGAAGSYSFPGAGGWTSTGTPTRAADGTVLFTWRSNDPVAAGAVVPDLVFVVTFVSTDGQGVNPTPIVEKTVTVVASAANGGSVTFAGSVA